VRSTPRLATESQSIPIRVTLSVAVNHRGFQALLYGKSKSRPREGLRSGPLAIALHTGCTPATQGDYQPQGKRGGSEGSGADKGRQGKGFCRDLPEASIRRCPDGDGRAPRIPTASVSARACCVHRRALHPPAPPRPPARPS